MTHEDSSAFPPSIGVRYALRVDRAARQALASLLAIEHGELLNATPSGPADRERHCIALEVLAATKDVLGRALSDENGETALSFMSGQFPDAFAEAATRLEEIDNRLKVAKTEEEVDPLADAESIAVYDLIATPARTLADVRLKLDRHRRLGCAGDDRDADAFASITRDLERLDCAA